MSKQRDVETRDAGTKHRIVIAGKGPSVDSYKFPEDRIIYAINELAVRVPCTYAVTQDYKILKIYRDHNIQATVVFPDSVPNSIIFDKMDLIDLNQYGYLLGTASLAIKHAIKNYNIKDMTMVGFDSIVNNMETCETVEGLGVESDSRVYGQYISHIVKLLDDFKIKTIWEI